jgi:hypothetical protein
MSQKTSMKKDSWKLHDLMQLQSPFRNLRNSVAELHHFYAAPAPDLAPGKNFDEAPAPAALAPAPTLLYSKAKFKKKTCWNYVVICFCMICIGENMNWMGYELLHFVSFFNS